MKKIVFATNNSHKLSEVSSLLASTFQIVSLAELKCFDDIPETANTLQGNALLKAEYIHLRYHCDCFADDTGLEVEALQGDPGVYSARYAGPECDAQRNMQKLLQNLEGIDNRKACFKTCIALIYQGKTHFFEGSIQGRIANNPAGNAGFGYDPIFIPDGYTKSFAELGVDEKNKISHRAIAVSKLVEFLNR